MTLVLIGLLGGIITGVSPCVLPVLPIVFVGGIGKRTEQPDAASDDRRRPYLIVLGLTLSFAVFTLFGTLVLGALHLPDSTIRWVGLALLLLVGIGLLVPQLGHLLERPFYRFPQRPLDIDRNGFVLGIALGAVFVPCAGPVLAAITVAGATHHIGVRTIGLTLGFAVGTAIPLLVFALAGRGMARRVAAYQRHQRAFRAVSGLLVVGLAVALTFNLSDVVQRDIPNYTNTVASSVEKDAVKPTGGAKELAKCQSAAYYDETGLTRCGAAPAFKGIDQWFNTPGDKPISIASLRGKVVLVDFWAYSCINCQRELPHVEAWAKAYAGDGLEVIGVHTPEYAFEHVPSNVEAGARRIGLTFPIALDSSYDTWNAYDNESWPAAYLIDATGEIRHISLGEGDYRGEEAYIRTLLRKAHPGVALPAPTELPDTTPTDQDQTPESYLGSARQRGYAGRDSYRNGVRDYAMPSSVRLDTYGLGGRWAIAPESITAGAGAAITLRYHASKVYLDVGGSGTLRVTDGTTTRTITVSGAPDIYTVASHHSARTGTVTIRLSHGLQAYSFTFG